MTLRVIAAIAAATAAFHLFAAGVSPFTALVQRPVHLLLLSVLGFLGLGIRSTGLATGAPLRARLVRGLLIAGAVFAFGYIAVQQDALVRRVGASTPLDLIAGCIALLVVLELTRRAVGWPLVVVAVGALAYAAAGPLLPGFLAHRGYPVRRVIEHLYLSSEGLWGVPLGVSADFVYLFILFGALLEVAGGGALLVALAARVAGRARGGPAMTAAVASALMGSLSGSAVANVATTGAVTIPLMKRAGFKPHFAGAIEAAASTGGQLMPPVMGAGAFILATWTNTPYITVATAALVPALLYYAALLAAIHFRAVRMGLEPLPELAREPVLRRLHLLLPLAGVIVLLALGRSPMRAAFWGVITALAVIMLRRETRLTGAAAARVLVAAASGAVQIAAACAAAGIIVGVASLTGIGLRMSELIILLSQGMLPLALLLTALTSLILGMGLPTTAAYVVLAALSAPALVALGVPLLAAHLFIFYFGCMSNVTPPVSLAAYAAAGMADAPPMRTAVTAMTLAGAGFIVPFMFVYGPPLLLIGSMGEIMLAIATALLGVTALAAAVIGQARAPLRAWERMLAFAAAIALIFPGWITDGIGVMLFAIVFRPVRALPLTAHGVVGTHDLTRDGTHDDAHDATRDVTRDTTRDGSVRGVMTGALLVVATLASACDGGDPAAQRFYSIGTAGTGGVYYPLGGTLANRLSARDPLRTYTAEVTGGSVENINRISNGEMELGFTISTSAYEAYHGGQDFPAPLTRLRVVAPLHANVTHVLVSARSNVRSVGQLRGRRVSVGAPGSGTEQVARQLLDIHELTYADVQTRHLSFTESVSALADGAIDAAIISAGYPASAVLESMTTGRSRLLAIDSTHVRLMRERHPYYSAAVIPAGAYPGVTAGVPTVSVLNWLVARDDLADDVVEYLLDMLEEEQAALRAVVQIAEPFDLQQLRTPPIPAHDAATVWIQRR
ncbi:MAG TPA: TRAP transporter fused permease subunit [Longimicrobiales bacterium]|nr:TRAP transporter fused permease subunit [Longimicrobiales bacterium]